MKKAIKILAIGVVALILGLGVMASFDKSEMAGDPPFKLMSAGDPPFKAW